MGSSTALKAGRRRVCSLGYPRSLFEQLAPAYLNMLASQRNSKGKGKARATSPPQLGLTSPSQTVTYTMGSLQSGFLIETSSTGDLQALDGGHELTMVVTTFRTLFEDNEGEYRPLYAPFNILRCYLQLPPPRTRPHQRLQSASSRRRSQPPLS